MRSLMEYYRPDLVFHSAAYKHVPLMEENPYEAVMTNVKGTKNMADLANEFGAEKFVLISTEDRKEHTSELQSRGHLVCRLLLEKKKNIKAKINIVRKSQKAR